jgi:hypothetical protein
MTFRAQRDSTEATQSRGPLFVSSQRTAADLGDTVGGESDTLKRYRRFFQTHDLRGLRRGAELDAQPRDSRTGWPPAHRR